MWLIVAGMLVIASLTAALYRARVTIQAWQEKAKVMVTALYQLQQRLVSREPYYEDSVTTLIAWPVFQDRLTQNMKVCARHEMTLGVLYIDLDDFKIINDALSFEVGDMLLKEVSSRLQSCIRQVDSISRPDKDTFVVMLNRLSKPETAAIVAQRMLHALARPYLLGDHALNVSATIGIAFYPDDALDVVSLLRHAEQALRMAKSKGKLTYQFYQSRLHDESMRELAIVNHVATEQVFNELEVFYQPIMRMSDESMEAMEVQLRWNHPGVGLIGQEELFAYADRQRRLNAITDWLLQKACRQFLNWHVLKFQPRLLAVPVLLKQLENTQFIYRLSQLMQQLHFNPSWLLLVIQETGAAVPVAQLEKAFNMLTYLGIKIAIDEQATSRFPMRYLKQFNFHYLRLEKSLASDVTDNPQTRSLIVSMLALTANLNMQLIVSGVNQFAQKDQLMTLGVQCMQGEAVGETKTERALADSLTMVEMS